MPREVIVFDTNALRNIGAPNRSAVHAAHRAQSIVSVASTFVALELISAMFSDDARESAAAHSAISTLVEMTRIWDGKDFVPFTEARMEQRLRDPELWYENAVIHTALSEWILRFAATASRPESGELAKVGAAFRAYVLKREMGYGKSLHRASRMATDLVKAEYGLTSDDEARAAAMRFLRSKGPIFTAEVLAMRPGVDPDAFLASEPDAPRWMLDNATVAVHFAHEQVVKAAGGEIDPRRPDHANSVWDARICALIDERARLGMSTIFHGAPLVVVSSERQILAAAEAAGHRSHVRSLGEHCRTIGLQELSRLKAWR